MRRRTVRGLAIGLALLWVSWAAVRVFGWDSGYPLVPVIAFTPYVAVTSVLPLIVGLAARSRTATALALVAMVAFSAVLLPRGFAGSPPAAGDGPRLRVASMNLFFGQADASTVVDLVAAEDVDVLAVQELTPDALARLMDAGINDLLPFSNVVAEPRSAGGGGLFSRLPLTELAAAEGLFQQPRVMLDVPGSTALAVTSVHAFPPTTSPDWVRQWSVDLAGLPAAHSGAGPSILVGDFNATLDHRALRDLLGTGYTDAAAQLGTGWTHTWSSADRPLPGLTLDHVLVPAEVGVESFEVLSVPGTDHRFVVAALRLPPT